MQREPLLPPTFTLSLEPESISSPRSREGVRSQNLLKGHHFFNTPFPHSSPTIGRKVSRSLDELQLPNSAQNHPQEASKKEGYWGTLARSFRSLSNPLTLLSSNAPNPHAPDLSPLNEESSREASTRERILSLPFAERDSSNPHPPTEAAPLRIAHSLSSVGRRTIRSLEYCLAPGLLHEAEREPSLDTEPPLRSPARLDRAQLEPDEKSTARMLTALIANHPEHKQSIILSHCWFTQSVFLLQSLCEEAVENRVRRAVLFECIRKLLCDFSFQDVPSEQIFGIFCSIPFSDEFQDLRANFKTTMWPSRPSIPVQPHGSPPQDGLGTPSRRFIDEIVKVVEERKEGRSLKTFVHHLSWDLKRLHALLFTQIRPSEFAAYKTNAASHAAPNIQAFVQHSNLFIYFVASHILSYDDPSSRAWCCKVYIRLMERSKKIRNLSAAFLLLNALQHTSVDRLKHTWELVGEKEKSALENTAALFHPDRNFNNYREHLKKLDTAHKRASAKHSAIPLLNLYLKDLTFIADGNPTYLEEGKLNLPKIMLLGTRQASFQNYQEGLLQFRSLLIDSTDTFDLRPHLQSIDEAVREKFGDIDPALETLYEKSEQREPRPAAALPASSTTAPPKEEEKPETSVETADEKYTHSS